MIDSSCYSQLNLRWNQLLDATSNMFIYQQDEKTLLMQLNGVGINMANPTNYGQPN